MLPSRKRPLPVRLPSSVNAPAALVSRKQSVSGVNPITGGAKTQRTSKTTQKLVLLPSAPQTKPLPDEDEREAHAYETDGGVRDRKSEGERMNKEQRKKAGFKRITAYCVAESFKMKLLASFLRREHNVTPRVFDDALYVMYHLPLLPGYGPHSNIRSSAPTASSSGEGDVLHHLSEAEEVGYQGTYFAPGSLPEAGLDGYMTNPELSPLMSAKTEIRGEEPPTPKRRPYKRKKKLTDPVDYDTVVEVVFFSYGVAVFFGWEEAQEQHILEDIDGAGIMKCMMTQENWEIEECHYVADPTIAYPRIYNDFFTFKTHSHLLKLSVSHAFAQSTLLSYYESLSARILSNPEIVSIPKRMAMEGGLKLKRVEALKMTGKLFKLRRDVNLVSNVLDIPELFWSEASLKGLYDAVRDYMEIEPRVNVLNEKLAVVGDLLDAIHDDLNNYAMERITIIIIWLIVAACFVEFGEIVARLIVHVTQKPAVAQVITREDALRALERMIALD